MKSVTFFGSLLLLSSCLAGPLMAQDPLFEPAVGSPQTVGDTVWVDLKVGSPEVPVQDLFGISFVLTYSSSKVEILGDEAGDFLGDNVVYQSDISRQSGEVGIGVSRKSGQSNKTGHGVVARVKVAFNKKITARTEMIFGLTDVSAVDSTEDPVALDVRDSTIILRPMRALKARSDTATGLEDQTMPLAYRRNDQIPASDTLTGRSITIAPKQGRAAIGKDTLTYKPKNNFYGKDSLMYKLQTADSRDSAWVFVRISSQNDSPVAKGRVRIDTLYINTEAGLTAAATDTNSILLIDESTDPADPKGTISRRTWYISHNQNSDRVETKQRKLDYSLKKNFSQFDSREGGYDISLKVHDNSGAEDSTFVGRVVVKRTTDLTESSMPDSYALKPNYPNPFNPTTRIQYSLPKSSDVELTVYDRIGRTVRTLVDGKKSAGRHRVTFEAAHLSSGVYIYRLQTDNFTKTRKMMLVR